jgi:stage II sporulation protein D
MPGGKRMRRVFIAVHLKNILLLICVFIIFLVITSVLIVGLEDNRNFNKDKNPAIKSEVNEGVIKNDLLPKISKVNVIISKENIIKEISLEDYVIGVVAAEMPAEFGIEALKAQSVAARTYALAHVKELGGTPCKNGNGADLCDTVHCQAYMTKEERMKLWSKSSGEKYWDKIKMAVEATQGQVLSYNNSLVMAPYYFATSSGKTENSEDVFTTTVPYLRSVESPGEEVANNFKSSKLFKYKDLSQIINDNYSSAKVTSANIKKQITIIDRTDAGSVKTIKIGNITITGSKFRAMLGLKSSNFQIKFNSNDVEIGSSGYGHGVGMSQWGANAMAKQGKSYIEILSHYYQGTELFKS